MKKILFLLILFSSLISAQNLYFSEPTSSHIDYIGVNGLGPIAYSMFVANGWVVEWWRAMLKDPDGIETNWMYGQTGGWWVSKAGTYQIRGQAWATLGYLANTCSNVIISLLALLTIMHRQHHKTCK